MHMEKTASHLKFRYDINALRAIAIIGVLLYHYKVRHLDGGFVGVDVFFVISGYLMSKIIITGIDKGNFSILDFYGRRLKRIVPPLLFLIFVLSVLGFFFYFPDDYQSMEKNSAASILFVSNILYWKSSNYFALGADANILLHTWSLSAEWQFYMIYPIILVLFSKLFRNKNQYLIFFCSVILILYGGTIYYSSVDKEGAFFLLPTRAWEMMFGGVAFLLEGTVNTFKSRKIIAIVGYAIVLISLAIIRSNLIAWPGAFTIVPVFATFMIVAANYNDFEILKNPAVQLIGKISYSLYLWHWPIYVIAQYFGYESNFLTTVVLTFIACILSYLSYTYIESVKYDSSRPILITAAFFLVCTGLLSFFNANSILFKKTSLKVANYKKAHYGENDYYIKGCSIGSSTTNLNEYNKDCLAIDSTKANILLLGDSHAHHMAGSLREQLLLRNANLLLATASGTYPILNNPNGSRKISLELVNYIYNDFVSHNANKLDGVIISANWMEIKGDHDIFKNRLQQTIKYLEQKKVKVILIGQNETYKVTYPVVKGMELQYNLDLSKRFLDYKSYKMNDYFKSNFKKYYVEIINKGVIPGLPVPNVPYMTDKNHFSKPGADAAVKTIFNDPITVKFLSDVFKQKGK